MSSQVLYAVIMAGVALACTYLGGIFLGFLCTFTTLIAYLEWYAITVLAYERRLYVPEILGYALLTLLPFMVFELHQRHALLEVFLIVWFTDIGALLGGKLIGGPKLWPSISPNKTVLGLLAGIMCGTFISRLLVESCFGLHVVESFSLRESLVLAFVAQLGDLAESACKRQAGIKDSNLPELAIPGHGGVLDRLDAMLLTAPLALIFICI